VLGFQYGFPIDVWSVGCVLYELYTGKILFEGADNNDMLRIQMETQGSFHRKLLKKSAFVSEHFDENFVFQRVRTDPVTGKELREQYPIKIRRVMLDELKKSSGVMNAEQFRVLRQLAGLISRCLDMDPAKRITPEEALKHEFIATSTNSKDD
jgi:serine/threonine-protein kinase PRP4